MKGGLNMHFSTIYILKGEELDNINASIIEEDFSDRFCYCCGETRPRYRYWCDWFQIGGRWCDILKAPKGFHCTRGYPNEGEPIIDNQFSVVEVKDLLEAIDENSIYSVLDIDEEIIYTREYPEFKELLDAINNKQVSGVIALIDCHD